MVSAAQRRAMFARMRSIRRSHDAQVAGLGTVAGTGLVGAMHPKVTHFNFGSPYNAKASAAAYRVNMAARKAPVLGVAGRAYRMQQLRGLLGSLKDTGKYSKEIIKGYPQLKFYPAIPAAAAYLAAREEDETGRHKHTRKQALTRAGTAGAVGLGAFLGERAMFHSLPALIPNKLAKAAAGIHVTPALRKELLLQHGVPLGVSALALAAIAHKVAKKHGYAKEQKAYKMLRTGALVGLGTVVGHFAANQVLRRYGKGMTPLVAKAAQKAVDMGVVPPLLAYQAWKSMRKRRAEKRARAQA